MTTMVRWAYENPFGKIGGDVVQHNPDYTEVEMTETDTKEFRSPASTVTQYQFQRLTPLRQGTPRKPLQSDTVMIDAPSVYDEQLALMIKQVQGASMYLYKLSNEDRKIATDQYTHLMNITEQLHKEFSETTNKDRNISAQVYEEFHKGSIDFAKQVYEKLNEHETDLAISKKYSDELVSYINTALEGLSQVTTEAAKEQNRFNERKEAQVQNLNKRLEDHSRDLRKAEKALKKLQQEKDKRTKQTPQITAKQIQELIDEGIKKNPISQ